MFDSSDVQLTPEALLILQGIEEETRRLRRVDLTDTPPAGVFEAD